MRLTCDGHGINNADDEYHSRILSFPASVSQDAREQVSTLIETMSRLMQTIDFAVQDPVVELGEDASNVVASLPVASRRQRGDRPVRELVVVPSETLKSLLDMAISHVDDIESGIEEGIYERAENADIGRKRATVDAVMKQFIKLEG